VLWVDIDSARCEQYSAFCCTECCELISTEHGVNNIVHFVVLSVVSWSMHHLVESSHLRCFWFRHATPTDCNTPVETWCWSSTHRKNNSIRHNSSRLDQNRQFKYISILQNQGQQNVCDTTPQLNFKHALARTAVTLESLRDFTPQTIYPWQNGTRIIYLNLDWTSL
jgi:hypothetical protein